MPQFGKIYSPVEAMQLAIKEAQKGAGFVSPNPIVGCVILDEFFKLIAVGAHLKFGDAHAEVNAIRSISDTELLKGAHVFVTLEPCAHHGKTPPCAHFLAQFPIGSVTYGVQDPNPLVAGKGLQILREAGISVKQSLVLQDELSDLAEVFFHNIKTKTPFVALKVATSLDGQMALRSGKSNWLTNEKAKLHSHYLRGQYDGIVVGANTILKDNPRLNVRHPAFVGKELRVFVLDPQGLTINRIQDFNLSSAHKPENVHFVVGPHVKVPPSKFQFQRAKLEANGCIDLNSWLSETYQLGLRSLFIEGGAFTLSEFLRFKVGHRLYLYFANFLIGGDVGLSWTSSWGVQDWGSKPLISRTKILNFDDQFLVTGRLNFE